MDAFMINFVFPALPNKRYNVLYVDPPYRYTRTQHSKTGSSGGPDNHYPTVSDEILTTLPIASICAPKAILFLWTSGALLQRSIALGECWGFRYGTCAFVWDKMATNPGSYTMSQAEFVLAFTRGGIPGNERKAVVTRGARNIRQIVSAPRTKHSAKPQEVADRIVQMFPNHARIELFARDKKAGWDSWGLDVPDITT